MPFSERKPSSFLVRRLAAAFLHLQRRFSWADLGVAVALLVAFLGAVELAVEWRAPVTRRVVIDLSPWALPRYTFFSLSRGLIAYCLSLVFTLFYGYWAAKDRRAEKVLLPLLDILQSIPVLGFMPGLVITLVAVFPTTNMGLELAAILMIFTGQAWNMTFSFYHSVSSLPADRLEVAKVYHFSWWNRLRWVELPSAAIGLIWNSMMSMAGGWFFLMINETFVLGNQDYRLPGIGSYMQVAVTEGDVSAMIWAILAMMLMIVALDQLLWRPLVAWGQKYRADELSRQDQVNSWFLNVLRASRLRLSVRAVLGRLAKRMRRSMRYARSRAVFPASLSSTAIDVWHRLVTWFFLIILFGLILYAAVRFDELLDKVTLVEWETLLSSAGLTLGRVLAATALGTLWAVPLGIAIGLSPRLSRLLQPVVQILASFPAPMLFPLVIAGLQSGGVRLGWGSIVLMLLGTQWYILFNVIAGAMAIPADLLEMATSYRMSLPRRFVTVYLPAIFPSLVTGWVTAAGGAWNASIVAEHATFRNAQLHADGLGSFISSAAARADFPGLAAGIFTMSAVVVVFNRLVWRRLYRVAQSRFAIG